MTAITIILNSKEESNMDMDMDIDAVLKEMVRRTITGLVKLDLSQDFFVSDTRIIKTAIRLLKDDNVLISHGMSEADIETDENYQKFSHRSDIRAQILSSLNQVELNVTAETIFEAIGYDEENIKDIFSSIPSEFDTLSFDDKKMLFFLTLCRCREIPISSLIDSNAFTLKDFFKLAKFALSITDKILKEIISHLREASFLRYDRKNEIFMITNNFDFELERLASLPKKIEKFDISDYDVSIAVPFGDIFNDSIITCFRSEWKDGISSFVYSLLTDYKIRFWYVDRDIHILLRIIDEARKLDHPCSPIIWIDNFEEFPELEEEKKIFKIITCAHAKVIISGHSFENPFGREPIDIALKSKCLPLRVKNLFPEELANTVIEYLNSCCLTGNMKKKFVKDLFDLYNCDHDIKYILKTLPDFQMLYDHHQSDELESDSDYENSDNDGKHSTDIIPFVTVLEPNDISEEELIFDQELSIQIDEITTYVSGNGYKKFQEVFRGKPLSCMFLGDPGTGKSAICKFIAKQTNRPLWWVEAGKIMDTLVGATEQKIEHLFAVYNLQTEISTYDSFPILLFNECDSLLQTRIENPGHGSEISYNTVNSILLDQIERCKGILFATSNMKSFDEAYSRRFIYKLHFEQPKNEFLIQLYHKFLPGLSDQQYKILLQYKISPDEIRTVQMKRELYNFFHNNIECDFSYIELCIKNMKFIPENTNSIGFQ